MEKKGEQLLLDFKPRSYSFNNQVCRVEGDIDQQKRIENTEVDPHNYAQFILTKIQEIQEQSSGESTAFSRNGTGAVIHLSAHMHTTALEMA